MSEDIIVTTEANVIAWWLNLEWQYHFFAGCALMRIYNTNAAFIDPDQIAPMAWDMADAMMAERSE